MATINKTKTNGARRRLTVGEMVAAAASLSIDLSGTVQERLQRAAEHARASRMHAALARAYAPKVEG